MKRKYGNIQLNIMLIYFMYCLRIDEYVIVLIVL